MHLNLDVFSLIHLFVSYTFNIFCILRHYSLVSAFKAVWSFVFVFFCLYEYIGKSYVSQHFKFQAGSP